MGGFLLYTNIVWYMGNKIRDKRQNKQKYKLLGSVKHKSSTIIIISYK